MAEIKLTQAQQAVVDNRGGALLVSAAAGSGKTKVLVDRLLSQICDPIHPCNIDDFLVITYTKAAAAELRVKISQALSQRLAREPDNRHLRRQMNRIYLAEISTVHAFCSNLLRTYAHLLDIPADFRVAEETESRMIQDKVLDRLLEEGYAAGTPEFRAMVETFGYGRDDRRLPDAIQMAHREMRCRPDMEGWIARNLEILDLSQYEDAAQTPWGQYILAAFRQFLAQQLEKLEAAITEMQVYPNIEKGMKQTFEANVKQLRELAACRDWDSIYTHKIPDFGRIKPVRKPEDPGAKERLAMVRTVCWQELKSWQELFFGDSKAVLADLEQVAPGAKALLNFARTFDQAYLQEKKRRKLMDFSDLEHETIRLLTDRYTGKPTQIAEEVSKRFVEILVDEYQDSNQVQDTIFEAISRGGKNRFMVGDVKQSIYRFRLADPSIFLGKYETYPDYREARPEEPRKILLSENFRSRPEILEACNHVFRLVMRKSVGDLVYGDREALKPGRAFPPVEGPLVELHCLTSSNPGQNQDKSDLEADYVARRIRRMLEEQTPITDGEGTRPVEPGDIVILMRSLSGTANAYLQALGRYGIPAVCDRGGNLLDTSEVQILVAILQILDNPHQDIPLLAALASPVFGFTPDQLALPRQTNRRDDYFDTISQAGGIFQPFLDQLTRLREAAQWMNLDDLIDRVFQETKMLAIFGARPDGLRRERNLLAFRRFAASFEAGGSRSLAQFLWYLHDLRTNEGQIPVPKTQAEHAVTIMTIHSSKGLEFPVVFLSDLSRKFNMRDMQDAILVDDQLSVGCNRVDHQQFVRYPTLAKKAIVRKKTMEAVSEELRVLYVAMTRAQDRLIMTYYSKYLVSELKNINSQLTLPLSDDLCASARSPGKWILMAALCRTEAGELLHLVDGNAVSQVQAMPWKICYRDLFQPEEGEGAPEQLADLETAQPDPSAISLLQYAYPYAQTCTVPAKLTATQIKGRAQDQEAQEGGVSTERRAAYTLRRPSFLTGGLTPTEKGTATHLFLQFASYGACTDETKIRKELDRLVYEKFLTREQADAVRADQVEAFFTSEFGTWLLHQERVHREFKFSILVDAADYDPRGAGETSMLQGVVDCFVEEEDGITILDFKTDRVGKNLTQRTAYYRPQLEAYGRALSRIYQLPIKRKLLYFFSAGELVEI